MGCVSSVQGSGVGLCFPWSTENIGLGIPHSRFATCCSALAV